MSKDPSPPEEDFPERAAMAGQGMRAHSRQARRTFRKKPWTTFAVAVCALVGFPAHGQASACVGQDSCASRAVTGAPAAPLLWADEFNGPAGSQPSGADWRYATGGRWGDGSELQCYTGRRANISEDGAGNLAITARYEPGYSCTDATNDYTSARIDTGGRHRFGYGRLEARIKLPHAAAGVWSIFWMLGADYRDGGFGGSSSSLQSGEIDILEWLGRDPAHATFHLHAQPDAGGHWRPGISVPRPWAPAWHMCPVDRPPGRTDILVDGLTSTWARAWHTYAVDRQPGRIDFLVDGKVLWTQTEGDAPQGAWDFDKPMYVLLNVAVGGWAGTPTPDSYPASMLVDYVRAYG
jgi:beta-glucanase (GH16 family)